MGKMEEKRKSERKREKREIEKVREEKGVAI